MSVVITSVGTATRTRGTIIKVPDTTPGLLIVNGQQLPFTLEGLWKSPVAPAANMSVDVELDSGGSVSAVSAVDAQQIARERLEQFGGIAQQQGKVAAEMARQGVGAMAARMGTPSLVAAVAVWIAWFFLSAVNINFFAASRSVTFWEILGLNLQNPFDMTGSHGLFSLIGLLAIAAPFARPFVTHPRAGLLNALPLLFIVTAVARLLYTINNAAGSVGASREVSGLVQEVLSLGSGTYVLFAASGFLTLQWFRSRS
jgi:hypothetical protein